MAGIPPLVAMDRTGTAGLRREEDKILILSCKCLPPTPTPPHTLPTFPSCAHTPPGLLPQHTASHTQLAPLPPPPLPHQYATTLLPPVSFCLRVWDCVNIAVMPSLCNPLLILSVLSFSLPSISPFHHLPPSHLQHTCTFATLPQGQPPHHLAAFCPASSMGWGCPFFCLPPPHTSPSHLWEHLWEKEKERRTTREGLHHVYVQTCMSFMRRSPCNLAARHTGALPACHTHHAALLRIFTAFALRAFPHASPFTMLPLPHALHTAHSTAHAQHHCLCTALRPTLLLPRRTCRAAGLYPYACRAAPSLPPTARTAFVSHCTTSSVSHVPDTPAAGGPASHYRPPHFASPCRAPTALLPGGTLCGLWTYAARMLRAAHTPCTGRRRGCLLDTCRRDLQPQANEWFV